MKKLSIILVMTVMTAVALFSCKDESGEFVEQLYTNAQKETAIKECLKSSADSAINHLCTPGGFSNYNNGAYRIDYRPLQNSMFDSLSHYGWGALAADSLIRLTNRMAEDCGAQIRPAFVSAIDSLEIVDYNALINGDEGAITHYFEIYKYNELKSAIRTPVAVRMDVYGVTDLWNSMWQLYVSHCPVPVNFDIQNYVVEKMLDGLLQEMRLEEGYIRADSTHRSESMELLGK